MKYVILIALCLTRTLGWGQEGLRKLNGTRLYVLVDGSENKSIPLVVIHGGPGLNHSYLQESLHGLARDNKVVFYDQRASGKSDIPSSDSISLKFFADDIDALRRDLNVERINILSHSWGALIAAEYGIRYPANVGKMIFCNPVPLSTEYNSQMTENLQEAGTSRDTTDRAIIRGSKGFRDGKPAEIKKLLMLSFRHSFYKPENIQKLHLEIPDNYTKASAALYQGLAGEMTSYDYYTVLADFKFPVMVLMGDADLTPVAAVKRIQTSIPNSTIIGFHKSGHFIFIEENRKFISMVRGFIK